MEARKLVKQHERNQTQLNTNNFLNFTYGQSPTKSSNWDRSRKLMRKPENKDQASKELNNKAKLKQISPTSNSLTKITVSSPTKSVSTKALTKINKLVRSNSGLYLTSAGKAQSATSTSGVRRKLTNPPGILKKQMSIDSLTVQAANLNLNQQQAKSPTKQLNFLQPFDQKRPQKPISAPASTGRSNELRSNPELQLNI